MAYEQQSAEAGQLGFGQARQTARFEVERAAFSLSAAGSTITPPASALGADPVAYAAGVGRTF